MISTIKRCIIIGAGHGGVSCAFALRKEGYDGEISLIDQDTNLPYHRPPLSKTFLTDDAEIEKYQLKSKESYEKEGIELKLGHSVADIDAKSKTVFLDDGTSLTYSELVLAVGARALYPPIEGLKDVDNLFVLRSAQDVLAIKKFFKESKVRQVLIIGGGYIGLEIAASFKKFNADVTILEREERVLSRVTGPEMSKYFQGLHESNGVRIELGKKVASIQKKERFSAIFCEDGSGYSADLILLGAGIKIDTALAQKAGLAIEKGIVVDGHCRTSGQDIWAIGDCTQHFNPHYQRRVRLESVQNATEQAKVAAASIYGKDRVYDSIPWFWSDQYDVKLQMVGLPEGYDHSILRVEADGHKRSNWYFKGDDLLAVDAIDNPKAYVLGTKVIKNRGKIYKERLMDNLIPIKDCLKIDD